jgi:hypothetical protein
MTSLDDVKPSASLGKQPSTAEQVRIPIPSNSHTAKRDDGGEGHEKTQDAATKQEFSVSLPESSKKPLIITITIDSPGAEVVIGHESIT